jgi:hypothetical protein
MNSVLVPSRRDVLRGLVGAGFGLGMARLPAVTESKKKRKNKPGKPKPAKPNAYGCLNVGAACSSAGQCCSGICQGKTCRGHDAGICQVDSDLCTTGGGHICDIHIPGEARACDCLLTTGNAPFCAVIGNAVCRDCRLDADCEEDFGPGAACVPQLGACEGLCPTTVVTACAPRCPNPAM